MSQYTFTPMEKESMKDCVSLIEASFRKNLSNHTHEYESIHLSEPPWSWYNQKNIYFYTLKSSNAIIAYAVWRVFKEVSHLHSFLVSADFQRKGIGTILLKYYENKSIQIEPTIEVFTLHTYFETRYNQVFYLKNGYLKYNRFDEEKIGGLKSWTENCKNHDDWPLTNNKLLFYKLNK